MRKLLVVVDMQNDFIDGALGTVEAQNIVADIDKYVREFDGDVAFTQDTHFDDYMTTQEGKNLPVKHCIKGSDGWKITDKIYMPEDCTIFEKRTFGSIDLGMFIKLNSNYYDEVYICGVCTDICVISNALLIKAFCPEMPIKVIERLCAGVTIESHNNAINAMKMCQIEVES